MEDYFRIDSHKLMFHVPRVNDWLRGKMINPIYLEIAPAGGCNHRCIFCALDYLNYQPVFLDVRKLKQTIREAHQLGVKSIMYAGEGEPLLHKDICDIVITTKRSGIDAAITTNGVLLRREISRVLLRNLSWMRISLNAGTAKTYSKIHRTKSSDFKTVLDNLADAVDLKKRKNLTATIGVQLLLIPENINEVVVLAKRLKQIGVDYITIKPYSQHPLSTSHIEPSFSYRDHNALKQRLLKLQNDRFMVIFRGQTMKRIDETRDYRRCFGLPFWAYIMAQGDVYACSAFLGKKEFCYGNIYKTSFKAIMRGRRRKEIIERVRKTLDVAQCREVCRLDKINSYLWTLKHAGPHINFI